MSLRSNDALVLVVAVVSIVGVAMVAATMGSMVYFDIGGSQQGPPDAPDSPFDDLPFPTDPGGEVDPSDDPAAPNMVFCFESLTQPASVLGIVGGLIAALYLVYLRANASASILVGSFLVPLAMLAYFLLTNCPGGGNERVGDSWPIPGDGPQGYAIDGVPGMPPALVGVLLIGVVVVAAAVLVSMSGRDEQFADETGEEQEAEPDAADFARAARRARQRIEEANVPVDNAVYQAWLEMTGLLAMDTPETAAPYEFAEQAIAVGLAEDDVFELTELFNDVRYGEKDADAREDRAVAVLRNIEETYQRDLDDRQSA